MHSSSLNHHWDISDPKSHPNLKGIHKVGHKIWQTWVSDTINLDLTLTLNLKVLTLNYLFEDMSKV